MPQKTPEPTAFLARHRLPPEQAVAAAGSREHRNPHVHRGAADPTARATHSDAACVAGRCAALRPRRPATVTTSSEEAVRA